MTQSERLILEFQCNENKLTLGQIMQTNLAAEYRARMSELRRKGYAFILTRGKTASENLYRMQVPVKIEFQDGQGVFA